MAQEITFELVCPICGESRRYFKEHRNRAHLYYKYLDKEQGIDWLNGKTYEQIKKRAERFIHTMGTDLHGDWTNRNDKGRAGRFMIHVLEYTKQYPDCVLEGEEQCV